MTVENSAHQHRCNAARSRLASRVSRLASALELKTLTGHVSGAFRFSGVKSPLPIAHDASRAMGAYLSQPVTRKDSTNGADARFAYGTTAMQGWRTNMEVRRRRDDADETTRRRRRARRRDGRRTRRRRTRDGKETRRDEARTRAMETTTREGRRKRATAGTTTTWRRREAEARKRRD